MDKPNPNYEPIEIARRRVQLLALDREFVDSEVTVTHWPITGGVTMDAKLVKHEKAKRKDQQP